MHPILKSTKTQEKLLYSSSPDFETQPVYNFNVIVSDGKYTDTQSVVLNVNDIYENIAPIFTSSDTSSVDENASVETVIYHAEATDVETITFSLGGIDQDFLEIDNNSTGEVTLLSSPDYETKSSYSFEVIASDGEFSSTKTVTVNVNDRYDGASFGSQDDQLEINVSTTSDVSGLFDGGEGFDELSLTVDQNATNGVIVDFGSGIQDEFNSAFIIPYDSNPSDVAFEINNWEKLLLTDNSDYGIITENVGVDITDIYDANYFTTSQSVLTIDPGFSGDGIDRFDIDANSQIELSYASIKDIKTLENASWINVSESSSQ